MLSSVLYGTRWVIIGSIALLTACLRVITLTALQTAGEFLSCVHDYRAFCTVQAVLQTATIIAAVLVVVSSHEFVSRGNRGNSDAIVERIPAAMLVVPGMLVQFAR